MLKLLLPIDGSKSAERAVRHAIALCAEGLDASVLLLHVQPHPLTKGSPKARRRVEMLRQLEEGEAVMRPAITLLERAGVRHKSHGLFGAPADVILKFSRDKDCDAIVMGTRGLGAITGLVLGSVTMKVIQLSQIPVTLVK
ncbi:MAG TPA: universal stress protein [Candidatus Desulfobacillus sp.]|nr:universal stress protein [Candidatus Desulfobacillus sp.]